MENRYCRARAARRTCIIILVVGTARGRRQWRGGGACSTVGEADLSPHSIAQSRCSAHAPPRHVAFRSLHEQDKRTWSMSMHAKGPEPIIVLLGDTAINEELNEIWYSSYYIYRGEKKKWRRFHGVAVVGISLHHNLPGHRGYTPRWTIYHILSTPTHTTNCTKNQTMCIQSTTSQARKE